MKLNAFTIVHRGLTLVRAVVGDDVEAEAGELAARVGRLKDTYREWARTLVGCTREPTCACPICMEARK